MRAERFSARLIGRPAPPPALLLAGLAVAALAALPAIYLVVAATDDLAAAWETIADQRTVELIARSLGLMAAVTISAILIAVPIAWLTSRTDLPAPRIWATLAALPLVIPSYIGAYLFVSALGPRGLARDILGVEQLPSIYGFAGAWIVLTLFTYPLILLSARAALLRLDPQLEDAAQAMGRSSWGVFRTIVLPQLGPAIGAGAVLVALYVLSDFGAVSIMRFDSFTREIYISYRSSFDRTATAALGCVLVALMIVLLIVQSRVRRRLGPGPVRASGRPPRIVALGIWKAPAIAFCTLIVGVGLVIPVGVLVWWAVEGIGADPDVAGLALQAWHSVLAGSGAALAAVVGAVVIGLLSVRHPSPMAALTERASYAGYALPGIVVAFALVFFGIRAVPELYQTLTMLIAGLATHFLPLAVGAVIVALLQISPRMEDAARSLGRGRASVFRTITAPLALGGIAAGAALVFLHAVKELPATLLLAPTGFQTLATELWSQTATGHFEAGALPALILLLVSAPALFLLTARPVTGR